MNLVMRGIDERDRTFAHKLPEVREQLGVTMNFLRVASPELGPPIGVEAPSSGW